MDPHPGRRRRGDHGPRADRTDCRARGHGLLHRRLGGGRRGVHRHRRADPGLRRGGALNLTEVTGVQAGRTGVHVAPGVLPGWPQAATHQQPEGAHRERDPATTR
ncbi:hypothetical protein ACFFX0_13140 [Citricoccus parietis]|uniref:Uncharacterized protein n=1 Tax=Citricoccus parietis TaxID=592307 RepID=A0ABV5FZJ4_9MICC